MANSIVRYLRVNGVPQVPPAVTGDTDKNRHDGTFLAEPRNLTNVTEFE